MNENLTIYISQPMENNSRTDRLFEHTKNNCYEMYPSATINSFPTEDSRQKDIWNSIYFNRDSLGIVCVISAGHIFLEPNKTFELVLEQTKGKTWWAIGHMIDRTTEGFYLRMFNSWYFINVAEMYDFIRERDGQVIPGFRPSNYHRRMECCYRKWSYGWKYWD